MIQVDIREGAPTRRIPFAGWFARLIHRFRSQPFHFPITLFSADAKKSPNGGGGGEDENGNGDEPELPGIVIPRSMFLKWEEIGFHVIAELKRMDKNIQSLNRKVDSQSTQTVDTRLKLSGILFLLLTIGSAAVSVLVTLITSYLKK